MKFSTSFIPDIIMGPGAVSGLAPSLGRIGNPRSALLVADSFLVSAGVGGQIAEQLSAAGIATEIFSDFAGEPQLGHVRAASAMAEAVDVVIGLGGGSALDIAKIAACCAASGEDPMHYALAANPLPAAPKRKVLIPTTAGTGSETSATSIFTGREGRKLWVWGAESKADLVILDPELTLSLPPHLTAWCGLDAFVHAFEACTNRNAPEGVGTGAKLHAHEALRLLAGSLETAVRVPGNPEARGVVLLGSCYAGIAIDNCGTAIAHNISHALAGMAPVHHGLATALAFELTLPWLVEADTPGLNDAAHVLGLTAASELPQFISSWMDRLGLERMLPSGFAAFEAAQLAREMRAPENQPMRCSTIREVTDEDIERFAAGMMSLPCRPPGGPS